MIGRRRAKTSRLPGLSAALALLLAACTNNPYPDADADAKVLYVAFSQPPKTLDPQVAYTVIDHSVLGNVFDALLEYAYLERPYRLIPGLAEAVPEAAPQPNGHVVYRFTLRPDLRFHSDPSFGLGGANRTTRTVTAADVAFSLQRIGDPAVGSPVIDTFAKIHDLDAFGERLEQARRNDPAFAALPAHEQYARVGGIAGVRALDARTLEVELSAAYPQILYWFAMPFTAPLPWEAVATYDGEDGRDNLADHPVGTGPFRLARYDRLSRIVLERNDDWYGLRHPEWRAPGAVYPSDGTAADRAEGLLAAAGQPLPVLDRIEFRRDPESVPAFIKFMQGYYDTSPIIRESFDRLVRKGALSADAAARGMELEKTVTAGVYYLGFNMDDPVLGSAAGERGAALRQAMSLAIDAEEFLRLFTNGRGLAAQSPLPPGIFGYDPAYQNPWRQPDLARAAERLAAAGYPNGIDPATGKPLHLTFDVSDTSARGLLMFQFLADAWKRIGLDVEIAATDYNQFQDKVRRGAYQIFYWGWVADYPDPENFLFLLYGPMSRTASGGPNTANFADPRYDALFERMRSMPNDAARTALIGDMLDLLEQQAPWIPLFYPEDYAIHHGWLTNVKPPAMSIQTYKYWDLDPPRRASERIAWNAPIRWPAYALLACVVLGGVIHRLSPQRHRDTEKQR
ncbi:MAG: ABC transporter substrate-binding protein [Deltaproteobacteria bacterium]|nr:ABC transporter substrate-binding protein [Deltaproteobacteria bacterium]